VFSEREPSVFCSGKVDEYYECLTMTTFSAVMDVTEESSISDKQSVSIMKQLLLDRGRFHDGFRSVSKLVTIHRDSPVYSHFSILGHRASPVYSLNLSRYMLVKQATCNTFCPTTAAGRILHV